MEFQDGAGPQLTRRRRGFPATARTSTWTGGSGCTAGEQAPRTRLVEGRPRPPPRLPPHRGAHSQISNSLKPQAWLDLLPTLLATQADTM